jgi:hypothetical protein
MIQARSRQAVALLSLVVLVATVRAEQPAEQLIQQTYPLANVLKACGNCPKCPAYLVQVIPHVVAPESWCDQGGQGSIEYCAECQALVIYQTPPVHKQVSDFLGLVEKMADACPKLMTAAPCCDCKKATCTQSSCPGSTADKAPKHVIRFVIDGFQYKDADKNGLTVQHFEIEYKGDGIEIDDAKHDTDSDKPDEKPAAEQEEGCSMQKLWKLFSSLPL